MNKLTKIAINPIWLCLGLLPLIALLIPSSTFANGSTVGKPDSRPDISIYKRGLYGSDFHRPFSRPLIGDLAGRGCYRVCTPYRHCYRWGYGNFYRYHHFPKTFGGSYGLFWHRPYRFASCSFGYRNGRCSAGGYRTYSMYNYRRYCSGWRWYRNCRLVCHNRLQY